MASLSTPEPIFKTVGKCLNAYQTLIPYSQVSAVSYDTRYDHKHIQILLKGTDKSIVFVHTMTGKNFGKDYILNILPLMTADDIIAAAKLLVENIA